MAVRTDMLGVTSIVRALGLVPVCYDRILDFFHSPALRIETLTKLWCKLVFKQTGIVRVEDRPVLVADGIKVAKSGKKMPAVKKLHQQSESNTKPEYIFGHSLQAVSVLMQAAHSVFAVPLICRIHEGVVFSNRHKRTLLDKMILLVDELEINEHFIFVADAYYAAAKIVRGMLKRGHHIISRARANAVAFESATVDSTDNKPRKRGRPKKYGEKIKLASLLQDENAFTKASSPIYAEKDVILSYRVADLLWRPAGILVRFVIVRHPSRGSIFLMATDTEMEPLKIIELYGLRFKIELSFKQALRVVGAFAYHFWMAAMTPIGRKSGNQYLHKKSLPYREAVKRKLAAYHRHIQLGIISQGLLQILAATCTDLVWRSFGSWIRTIRPGLAPSEMVTAIALRNSLPDFLADDLYNENLTKFLADRIDVERTEGMRLTI
jgi:hypothetical protein